MPATVKRPGGFTREIVLGGEEPPLPVHRQPIVLYTIIALNIVVYMITSYATGFVQSTVDWIARLGFVPARLLVDPAEVAKIFTAMFTHADIAHIFFNMYFLYIFGRAVERALGSGRFLALYLGSGILAAVFHTVFTFIQSPANLAIPSVGASGAISGVLGAYMLLFPGTRLAACFFLFFIPVCFEMLAAYYLLFWFAIQVIEGYTAFNSTVAFFAHAGGFLAGIALLPPVADERRLRYLKLLSREYTLFGFVRFLPWMRRGLSPTAKMLFASLAAILVTGTLYSYLIASSSNIVIASYNINIVHGNNHLVDEAFVIVDPVAASGTPITRSTTELLARISFEALWKAGLIYNPEKAGGKAFLPAAGPFDVAIPLTLYRVVHVETVVTRGVASYDEQGLAVKASADIAVRAFNYAALLNVDASMDSKANASKIIEYLSLASVATSLAALYVVLYRDEDYVITPE